MIDYIIVGSGLAGLSFAHLLEKHNKTFVIFDDESQNSTQIAAGLYNPVVLKRFTSVWKAKEQLDFAIPFYKEIETKLQFTFLYEKSLFRILKSIEEQNLWFEAADKPLLNSFLNSKLSSNINTNLVANFKFGEVIQAGYLDTKLYKSLSQDYFIGKHNFINESFIYEDISKIENFYSYKNLNFKNIVFCEGFGLYKNPYFNKLPLDGTKGEILTIKSPELKLNNLINSSVFIIPLGKDLYRVGATYNWTEKDSRPTIEGKNELLENLRETIKCDFEIIHHDAGVRPTVKHRRPLLGSHQEHENFYIFNGLGTRGVMLAPFLANQLFNHIEFDLPLDHEVDITKIKKPAN